MYNSCQGSRRKRNGFLRGYLSSYKILTLDPAMNDDLSRVFVGQGKIVPNQQGCLSKEYQIILTKTVLRLGNLSNLAVSEQSVVELILNASFQSVKWSLVLPR